MMISVLEISCVETITVIECLLTLIPRLTAAFLAKVSRNRLNKLLYETVDLIPQYLQIIWVLYIHQKLN